MSATEFSIRACTGGPNATKWCPHIYDVMGAQFNHPGNYGNGFDDCDGESGQFTGERVRKNGSTSTFHQGDKKTPSAHPPGASSNCKPRASPTGGVAKKLPYRRSVSARGAEEVDDEE